MRIFHPSYRCVLLYPAHLVKDVSTVTWFSMSMDVVDWRYTVRYLLELPVRCLAMVDDLADLAPSNLNPPRSTQRHHPL